jgi:23S rRNA maturation-related 3'-5' exoribonuclease YhaM
MIDSKIRGSVLDLLRSVKREGMTELIDFLLKSDYFTAPASTRFHLCYEGGLLEHSWNVFSNLLNHTHIYPKINIAMDTLIICGLLHDVCKVNFYKQRTKKSNNILGDYEVIDSLPVGHGEKSVIVLQRYINLTDEEIVSIRWHMSAFDVGTTFGTQHYAYDTAIRNYPLAVLLFTSDFEASSINERETIKKVYK